ncbi:MAG: response regulator [Bacillota bacterium]|nr:response regulator [Bacillota bacterium]
MKRILIVDDAAFMRLALKSMLEKNGFEIAGEAENGLVAIQKYRELKPDLVTMDITMPEMDGIEAIKNIMEINPEAKIAVVSAVGQEAMVRRAIIAGASAFIVKPFKEDYVVESLGKL